MKLNPVRLSTFRNTWYQPGRSAFVRASWFLIGCPLVRSALIPSSALRSAVLKLFGTRIGVGVVLKPGVQVKYPWRLSIGDDSWIGENCWIDNLADVSIGRNVCISQGAHLCTGNHDWSDPSFGLILRSITLNDGSWVGAQSFIGPGVELGQCAVATAGAVVTKSIPEYQIHSGNPAQFIRIRNIQDPANPNRSSPTPSPTLVQH